MKKLLTKENYDRLVDKFLKTTPVKLPEIERMKKTTAAASEEGRRIRHERELSGR